MRMGISADDMILKATGEANDAAEVAIPCQYDGPAMTMAVNIHYLLDAMGKAMGGSRVVRFGIHDGGSGMLLFGDANFPLAVIMPVKVT